MDLRLVKTLFNEIDSLLKKEIDFFITNNNGLIFHETGFNEILSFFIHSLLYYYLVYRNDILVALCPIHKRRRGILSDFNSGMLDFEIPYGGWVHFEEIEISILLRLLKPSLFENYNYFSGININADFRNLKAYQYWTAIIDLKREIEDIWDHSIDSKRRNMIRKAQRSEIEISQHESEAIEDFYRLLKEMNKKTGMISKSKDFYNKLLEKYSDKKARIFLANRNKQVIAGIFLLGNSNIMHYWQGASLLNSGNFGQGELLQWEAIKWCSRNGIKYYDLCYLYSQKQLDEKAEKQNKIAAFKLGFSKNLAQFYYLNNKAITYKVFNKLQNVFNI